MVGGTATAWQPAATHDVGAAWRPAAACHYSQFAPSSPARCARVELADATISYVSSLDTCPSPRDKRLDTVVRSRPHLRFSPWRPSNSRASHGLIRWRQSCPSLSTRCGFRALAIPAGCVCLQVPVGWLRPVCTASLKVAWLSERQAYWPLRSVRGFVPRWPCESSRLPSPL